MQMLKLAGALAILMCALATPAHAQQTLNFSFGGVIPFGENERIENDVLIANGGFLRFDLRDFAGGTVGVEWLVPVGPVVEFGAGVAVYRRTVPTVYRDFIASDGSEIDQSLRLRMAPITLSIRIVPTGQNSPVQPYLGVGLAIVSWRYSEFGDFIDFGTASRVVRPGTFVLSGTEVAPVVLGGVRFGSGALSAGAEVRYQRASTDLDSRFAAPRLDLGAWTVQGTFGIRFGR